MVMTVVLVGIFAWALVRITDKNPWVQIALAILGVGTCSTPSVVAWRLYIRLKNQIETNKSGSDVAGEALPNGHDEAESQR